MTTTPNDEAPPMGHDPMGRESDNRAACWGTAYHFGMLTPFRTREDAERNTAEWLRDAPDVQPRTVRLVELREGERILPAPAPAGDAAADVERLARVAEIEADRARYNAQQYRTAGFLPHVEYYERYAADCDRIAHLLRSPAGSGPPQTED